MISVQDRIQVLKDALEDDDSETFDNALSCDDDDMKIVISQLLQEDKKKLLLKLQTCLKKKHNILYSKWVLNILTTNMKYFQTCKNAGKYLDPFKFLFKIPEEKTALHKLKGCLEMLLEQAASSKANLEIQSDKSPAKVEGNQEHHTSNEVPETGSEESSNSEDDSDS